MIITIQRSSAKYKPARRELQKVSPDGPYATFLEVPSLLVYILHIDMHLPCYNNTKHTPFFVTLFLLRVNTSIMTTIAMINNRAPATPAPPAIAGISSALPTKYTNYPLCMLYFNLFPCQFKPIACMHPTDPSEKGMDSSNQSIIEMEGVKHTINRR